MKTAIYSSYNELDTHILIKKYEEQLSPIISIENGLNHDVTFINDKGDKLNTHFDIVRDVIIDYKKEAIEWYSRTLDHCVAWWNYSEHEIKFTVITDKNLYIDVNHNQGCKRVIVELKKIIEAYENKDVKEKYIISDLIDFFRNKKYKNVIGGEFEINLVNQSYDIKEDIEKIDNAIKAVSVVSDSMIELEENGFNGVISVKFFESGINDIVTISIDNDDGKTTLSVVTCDNISSINSLIKFLINERVKLQDKLNAKTPIKSKLLLSVLSQVEE
jgi:hypothetical protein